MELNATTLSVAKENFLFSANRLTKEQYEKSKPAYESASLEKKKSMKGRLLKKKLDEYESQYLFVPEEYEIDALIEEEEMKKKEAEEELAKKLELRHQKVEAIRLKNAAMTIFTAQKEEKKSRQQEAIAALSKPDSISVPRVRKIFFSMRAGESDDPVSGGIDETSVAKDIGDIVAERRKKMEEKRRYIVAMKIVGKR